MAYGIKPEMIQKIQIPMILIYRETNHKPTITCAMFVANSFACLFLLPIASAPLHFVTLDLSNDFLSSLPLKNEPK